MQMALEQRDLDSIDRLLKSHLEPIWEYVKANIDEMKADLVSMRKDIGELKTGFVSMRKDIDELKTGFVLMRKDVDEMKGDLALLARLNQLDEIRKDARLRVLYASDTKEA